MNLGLILVIVTIILFILVRLFVSKRISEKGTLLSAEKNVELTMQVIISVAGLGAGLYIILSQNFEEDSIKWAYGLIGTIFGFWLKKTAA